MVACTPLTLHVQTLHLVQLATVVREPVVEVWLRVLVLELDQLPAWEELQGPVVAGVRVGVQDVEEVVVVEEAVVGEEEEDVNRKSLWG